MIKPLNIIVTDRGKTYRVCFARLDRVLLVERRLKLSGGIPNASALDIAGPTARRIIALAQAKLMEQAP